MIYSICNQSGLFTGDTFGGSNDDEFVRQNTPAGMLAIAGLHDPRCRRFDAESGEVVPYQPPQPDPDHEWNTTTERWQLKPEVVERQQQVASIKAQLLALDPRETRAHGDVLGLLLGTADPASLVEAQQRLLDVRAQKDRLRQQLRNL